MDLEPGLVRARQRVGERIEVGKPLDFGGARNPDGQGFAAFGRVVSGMDVVRKIQRRPNTDAQRLTPPIKIVKASRMP